VAEKKCVPCLKSYWRFHFRADLAHSAIEEKLPAFAEDSVRAMSDHAEALARLECGRRATHEVLSEELPKLRDYVERGEWSSADESLHLVRGLGKEIFSEIIRACEEEVGG